MMQSKAIKTSDTKCLLFIVKLNEFEVYLSGENLKACQNRKHFVDGNIGKEAIAVTFKYMDQFSK